MKSKILSCIIFILFSLSLSQDLIASRGGGGHGGGGGRGGGSRGGGSHRTFSSSRGSRGSRPSSRSSRSSRSTRSSSRGSRSGSRSSRSRSSSRSRTSSRSSRSGRHGSQRHGGQKHGGRGRGGHGGHHGSHNWHNYQHGGYWYGGWGLGWWAAAGFGLWYGPWWGWWYPAFGFSVVLSPEERVVYVENEKEADPLYFATYKKIWTSDEDYYLTRVSGVSDMVYDGNLRDSLKVELPEDNYQELQVVASRGRNDLAQYIKQDDKGNIQVLDSDQVKDTAESSALNVNVSNLDEQDRKNLEQRHQERDKNKKNFDREMSKAKAN